MSVNEVQRRGLMLVVWFNIAVGLFGWFAWVLWPPLAIFFGACVALALCAANSRLLDEAKAKKVEDA
jgi:hypothetical protein